MFLSENCWQWVQYIYFNNNNLTVGLVGFMEPVSEWVVNQSKILCKKWILKRSTCEKTFSKKRKAHSRVQKCFKALMKFQF